MSSAKQPEILAFVCNWCAYAGADLAGVSRMQYPTNVRLIRVMCTGRVNHGFLLKAFLKGADGVLVSGCNPGDCHYINGNYKARRRIKLLKEILPQFGFEAERLRLTWIAASDGVLLAETLQNMVEQIRKLGPSEAKLQMVI